MHLKRSSESASDGFRQIVVGADLVNDRIDFYYPDGRCVCFPVSTPKDVIRFLVSLWCCLLQNISDISYTAASPICAKVSICFVALWELRWSSTQWVVTCIFSSIAHGHTLRYCFGIKMDLHFISSDWRKEHSNFHRKIPIQLLGSQPKHWPWFYRVLYSLRWEGKSATNMLRNEHSFVDNSCR